MISALKKIIILTILISLFLGINKQIFSQTVTPTPTASDSDSDKLSKLQEEIRDLQNKISDSQKQQKTLSSQISVMNSQIRLTELKINAVKQELIQLATDIETANKKISNLEDALGNLTKVLVNRIVATYEVGRGMVPLELLLSSKDMPNFLTRANYLKIAQAHDKELIYETQQAKNDYANQKEIFEDKKKKVESLKKQLESYTTQLDQEKKDKQSLLAVTKNDEEKYQKLLKDAQAQIQAFKSFSLSQTGGGVSILPPQPSPDGWYFNQRDERWGRNAIGISGEQVWDVGCLLTSITMVLKKHGENITPSDVASNSSYFFSNTAYMLLPWAGGRFSSIWGANLNEIDTKLSSGEPVIVGLRAGVYGMHFVVFKSGSNGDYVINDPWHGPNLKFSDYYSTSQIFQYGFYNG